LGFPLPRSRRNHPNREGERIGERIILGGRVEEIARTSAGSSEFFQRAMCRGGRSDEGECTIIDIRGCERDDRGRVLGHNDGMGLCFRWIVHRGHGNRDRCGSRNGLSIPRGKREGIGTVEIFIGSVGAICPAAGKSATSGGSKNREREWVPIGIRS
jgi:hypothetical protein